MNSKEINKEDAEKEYGPELKPRTYSLQWMQKRGY